MRCCCNASAQVILMKAVLKIYGCLNLSAAPGRSRNPAANAATADITVIRSIGIMAPAELQA